MNTHNIPSVFLSLSLLIMKMFRFQLNALKMAISYLDGVKSQINITTFNEFFPSTLKLPKGN